MAFAFYLYKDINKLKKQGVKKWLKDIVTNGNMGFEKY